LLPNYFREPNVNLGFGSTFGQLPHVVGNKVLKEIGVKPGSPEAYAFTYNNFEDLAAKYGKTGGFGQIKTVLDSLRESAGGVQNTLTLDGGDTSPLPSYFSVIEMYLSPNKASSKMRTF
jgi:sulfur-oxidizing protein SoxB